MTGLPMDDIGVPVIGSLAPAISELHQALIVEVYSCLQYLRPGVFGLLTWLLCTGKIQYLLARKHDSSVRYS